MNVKKWNAGVADEPWKVKVSENEIEIANKVLSRLVYILTDAGSNEEAGIRDIMAMSGEQIIKGVLDYRKAREDAIRNGAKKSA